MAKHDDSGLQARPADFDAQARERLSRADQAWALALDHAAWGLADEAGFWRAESRRRRVQAMLLQALAGAAGGRA